MHIFCQVRMEKALDAHTTKRTTCCLRLPFDFPHLVKNPVNQSLSASRMNPADPGEGYSGIGGSDGRNSLM